VDEDETQEVSGSTPSNSAKIPQNLPRSGVVQFVGRDQKLIDLSTQLQQNNRIAITAVKGMGGIGKTELALQYAMAALPNQAYPGGICWLRSRDQEIATQIISFARVNLGLTIPEDMEAQEQVAFIWQRWPAGNKLIVIDDVTDYAAIAPYLPPADPRFKVLITTRQNFGASVTTINIEELSDTDAIALLKSIVGAERIESQRQDAQSLCQWVGNLPLGLELLGRFLVKKPDWAITKLLERLESKRLAAQALLETEAGMTATLGVAAALELSWTELSEPEQDLAYLLGMFAVAPIPWNLVEQCFSEVDWDDLEDWRDKGLRDRSLITRVDQETYQLHQVVQEFFRAKLQEKGEFGDKIKSSFGTVMVAQTQSLDDTPTLDQIEQIRGAIAHLEEVIIFWTRSLSDEDFLFPFIGVILFHQSQLDFKKSQFWAEDCVTKCKHRFGEVHQEVAFSIGYLADIRRRKGEVIEAQKLYSQALNIQKEVFGEKNIHSAGTIFKIAATFIDKGQFDEAEKQYKEALSTGQKA
jgi:tetratricopeptide (TPR) repeat protein